MLLLLDSLASVCGVLVVALALFVCVNSVAASSSPGGLSAPSTKKSQQQVIAYAKCGKHFKNENATDDTVIQAYVHTYYACRVCMASGVQALTRCQTSCKKGKHSKIEKACNNKCTKALSHRQQDCIVRGQQVIRAAEAAAKQFRSRLRRPQRGQRGFAHSEWYCGSGCGCASQPQPRIWCAEESQLPPANRRVGQEQSSPACWVPYSHNSAWNRQLPANPKLHPKSSDIVKHLFRDRPECQCNAAYNGPHASRHSLCVNSFVPICMRVLCWFVLCFRSLSDFTFFTNPRKQNFRDWGHPLFFPSKSDPLVTIRCTGKTIKTHYKCPVDGMKIRLPHGAKAAGIGNPKWDGHMGIIDQEKGIEISVWRAKLHGNVLHCDAGGVTHLNGDGRGPATTGIRSAVSAGAIRIEELMAGEINHAIFMLVKCTSKKYVYPATTYPRACGDHAAGTSAADQKNAPLVDSSSSSICLMPR